MPKVSFAPDEWWPVLEIQDETYNDDWDVDLPEEELAAFKAAQLAFAKASIAIFNRFPGDGDLLWAEEIVSNHEKQKDE